MWFRGSRGTHAWIRVLKAEGNDQLNFQCVVTILYLCEFVEFAAQGTIVLARCTKAKQAKHPERGNRRAARRAHSHPVGVRTADWSKGVPYVTLVQ